MCVHVRGGGEVEKVRFLRARNANAKQTVWKPKEKQAQK
jgi:hypothetical protein